MSEEYTLPRVMQFLQLEWQRNERDKIQWEIERAEMKSRIAKLETDKRGAERKLQSARRTLEMVGEGRERGGNGESGPVGSSRASELGVSHDTQDPQSAARADGAEQPLAKLVSVRQYLDECVQEVHQLLDKTGVSESVSLQSPGDMYFGARSRLVRTLCNFRGDPTAIVAVLGHLFVVGTDDGSLIMWDLDKDVTKTVECDAGVLAMHVDNLLQLLHVVTTEAVHTYKLVIGSSLSASALTHVTSLKVPATAASFCDSEVAVCTTERAVVTIALDPLSIERTLKFFSDSMSVVPTAVKYDKRKLLIGYSDGGLLLADPATSQLVKRVHSPAGTLSLTKVAPSVQAIAAVGDNTVITGHATGDIRVYDLARGQLKEEITSAHARGITSLSGGVSSIVSTSIDGNVSLWSVNLGSLAWYGRLLSHDALECGGVLCSLWSKEDVVVVGGGDGLVRVYSMV